ncbi:MAG: tetratricopeptide repeat protein, partial [Bacteroidetes bacterium]|nr:tetratricopeptide repeat protein [Bacteroidota bacterium]
SDIFSFGVVLYELLTANLPFNAEHQAALVYTLINEDPQPVARFNNKVTQELEHIVLKALAKNKEERYQHIDDMLADLRRERKNLEYAKSGYIKASTINQINTEKSTGVKIQKDKKTLKIIIPSVIVILLVVAFFFFNPFKLQITKNQTSVTPGNTLAIMYFENIPNSEDTNHNGEMLTNLLITSLSQVKGLEVISRERLQEIQKELGGTDTKKLTPALAGKVAARAGVTTMLIGSILQEKPMLAVTTRLIDVQSGKIINSQQLTNFTASKIFNLVDSLAILINNNLQPTTTTPIKIKSVSDVTTKSPEAYRAYVTGLDLADKLYLNQAKAAFQQAIKLDNNFAMAYYLLSSAQAFTGITEASLNSLKKAVELSDNTTERERLQILALNYLVHNNLSKAVELYSHIIEQYPHEIRSYIDLGFNVYSLNLLESEKTVQLFRRALKIEPLAKNVWNVLSYTLARLNRKQEALEAVNSYIKLAPAEPNPYDTQGDIYAWFQNYDSSRASYEKSVSLDKDFGSNRKLGSYFLLRQQYNNAERYFKSDVLGLPLMEAYKGRIKIAEKIISTVPESQITERGKLSRMINYLYESGQYVEMLRIARQLSVKFKKNPSDKIYGRDYLAWALVKNGKLSEAHKMIDAVQKDVNGVSPLLQVTADYASALVSLEEGNNNLALESFRKVFQALPPNHEPNLYYGISLLKTGQTSRAIEEFQRLMYWPGNGDNYIIRNNPGSRFAWPIPAVKTHYWLGVAYEKQGKKDKALSEYKKFLEIWKDADFNSPEINDAKVRITKLK